MNDHRPRDRRPGDRRPPAPQRGSTLVECAVAAALLTTLALGYGAGDRSHDLAVRHAWERSMAELALSNAIEADRASSRLPAAGTARLADDRTTSHLENARLTRHTQRVEPGLWELTYRVTWTPAGALPDAATRQATRRVRRATELGR